MNIIAEACRSYVAIRVNRWEVIVSSRAWADDTLDCWDAGAVAYHRDECGERSLRLPFVAVFWGAR